jgi:chemotaxis receptor (MCP) glutamine deamidase CheD
MFNGSGPLQIGEANAAAVAAALTKAGIRVAAHDVGGTRGRRVEFDAAAGELVVEYAGQPARTL